MADDDDNEYEEWIASDIDHATRRGIRDGVMRKPFNPPRNPDPVYRQEYAWGYDYGKNKDARDKEARERSEKKGCAASFVLIAVALTAPFSILAGYLVHMI